MNETGIFRQALESGREGTGSTAHTSGAATVLDPVALEGLRQLDSYLAGLSLDSGWLVIFDQRPGLPPIAERTTTEVTHTPTGRSVTVIRG